MPVTVFAKKHVSGSHCPINGSRKTDAYRFTRNVRTGDWPSLTLSADAFNKISEDLFSARNNPTLFVRVTPEVAAGDLELAGRLEAAEKERAAAVGQLDDLRQQIEQLKLEKARGGDSEEVIDTHDKLLAVLAPHRQEGETPIEVLLRLVADKPIPAPEEDTAGTGPKEYHPRLKWAKETLGLEIKGNIPREELDALIDGELQNRQNKAS